MCGREYTSYLTVFGSLTDFKVMSSTKMIRVVFVASNILGRARQVRYPAGARHRRNSLPK